jgi:hypothetical protein
MRLNVVPPPQEAARQFELRENRCSDSCTLHNVVNFYPLLPYFFADWMKFSITRLEHGVVEKLKICVESLPFT